MTALAIIDAIGEDMDQRPLFPVQAPDGRRDWSESARQRAFFNKLRMAAPSLIAWHTPNAGRRNPSAARRAGIMGGVFDCTVASGAVGARFTAYPEFKGYDARGRPGTLSPAQIDWGNRMWRAGHPVACFFCPDAAVAWIKTLAPVAFMGCAR
jgi:hypothetical protein